MKKLVLIVSLVLVSTTIFAQEDKSITTKEESYRVVSESANDRYKVETNRFWSNWFLGIGGGAQMYFGDHNKQMNFKDRLSPAFEVALGKWFTPGIGVRLMYNGRYVKGATQNGSYSTGKVYDASQGLNEQKFNYAYIHGDVMFNANNIFCGYKEKRCWTISPYVGVGMMMHEEHPRYEEVGLTIGLFNSFRVARWLDIAIDVKGTMVNDRFDGEVGARKQEGVLSATLGLYYKFKKRNWDRSSSTVVYDDTELSRLRDLLSESEGEISRLKADLADKKEVVKEVAVSETIIAPVYVTFPIGKSKLSLESRVILGFYADLLKNDDSDAVYVITGYADAETGNPTINERLSKERTEAVYNCLVNEFNIPAEKFRIEYKGGVDNMFYNSPALSRAVITRAER